MYSDDTVHTLSNYITALHILHSQHVLDGYGHLSIRNSENPHTFFLFHTVPSALVSSLNDIGEYYIADATPANSSTPEGFKERFIHSEILKRYKSVNVVLHGHSEELLIYSLGGERLQPVIHMAGFLGQSVPIFDINKYYHSYDTQDFLVSTEYLGSALAWSFSADKKEKDKPDYNLVLMKCHGFTTVAVDLETATYQGIYAQANARVQAKADVIRKASFGMIAEAACLPTAEEERQESIFLRPRQVEESWSSVLGTIRRPWMLWEREVWANPLYVNNLRLPRI